MPRGLFFIEMQFVAKEADRVAFRMYNWMYVILTDRHYRWITALKFALIIVKV